MSKPYLITFTPTGRFFFGASESFGEGFNVQSLIFPTQFTLLGCLRYNILKQNEKLDKFNKYPLEDSDYEAYTGSSTGMIDEDNSNFGKIKRLSPLFISYQPGKDIFPQDFLFPVPADIVYEKDDVKRDADGNKIITGLKRLKATEVEEAAKSFCRNQEKKTAFKLDNEKEESASCFAGRTFWNKYLGGEEVLLNDTTSFNEIFIEDRQPGIAREKRKAIDKKFYIKKDFRFNKDYKFGVIAHLDEGSGLKDDDVFLGGERSLFRLKIKEIKEENIALFNDHMIIKRFLSNEGRGDYTGKDNILLSENECLIFFSHFFSKENPKEVSYSFINNLTSIRSLKFKGTKTETFNIIEAGSVIYGPIPKVDTYHIPEKIGYNFVVRAKKEFKK